MTGGTGDGQDHLPGLAEVPAETWLGLLTHSDARRHMGLACLGFEPAGEFDYDGHRFIKFRLRHGAA
jgi:hypothetical protein